MTKKEKKLLEVLAILYQWYDNRMKNDYYDQSAGDDIWLKVKEILDERD